MTRAPVASHAVSPGTCDPANERDSGDEGRHRERDDATDRGRPEARDEESGGGARWKERRLGRCWDLPTAPRTTNGYSPRGASCDSVTLREGGPFALGAASRLVTTRRVLAAICGARFRRIVDGADVVCILERGHVCAHAWGRLSRADAAPRSEATGVPRGADSGQATRDNPQLRGWLTLAAGAACPRVAHRPRCCLSVRRRSADGGHLSPERSRRAHNGAQRRETAMT